MTWSEAFDVYCTKNGITSQKAAEDLGVAVSTVHYWRKGSEPRGESGRETKVRVEEWTRGDVKAAPWPEPTGSDPSLHRESA